MAGRWKTFSTRNIKRSERCFLLEDVNKNPLSIKRIEDALEIHLPSTAPDSINSVVVLDVIGKPDIYNPPSIKANYNIFIDTLNVTLKSDNPKAEIRYTVDGTIPTNSSPIYKNEIIINKTSTITARIFANNHPITASVKSTFTKVNPYPAIEIENLEPGIKYNYYEGNWEKVPDFENIKPLDSGVIKNFDVLHQNKKDDYYGFEFTGLIKIDNEGVYKFFTESDDGSLLYIDDNLVVDNDNQHGLVEKSGAVPLSKGFHKIKVSYFEASGDNNLNVRYEGPGIKYQVIPDSVLYYESK